MVITMMTSSLLSAGPIAWGSYGMAAYKTYDDLSVKFSYPCFAAQHHPESTIDGGKTTARMRPLCGARELSEKNLRGRVGPAGASARQS
jgi:hypothetical protein